MTQKRTITCTVCPKGCRVTVQFDKNGEVVKISGNACPKGETYARAELVNPKRVLTSTVRVIGGEKPLVSVKTDAPVPLASAMDCMREINALRAKAPVIIGDALILNVAKTGANIIATSEDEEV